MRSMVSGLAAATFIAAIAATQAVGAIVQYNDRPSWLAAVGTPTHTEDFEGFASDTSFQKADGPVALNGMSLYEIGPDTYTRNIIDVAPFLLNDSVNGTTDAYIYLSKGFLGLHIDVDLSFDLPVTAWGADFGNARGGAILDVEVYDTASTLLATMTIPADDSFLGFNATAGETVGFVRFTPNGGSTDAEDLQMDNVAISAIPEPTTLAIWSLLATLGISVGWWRRRRRAP